MNAIDTNILIYVHDRRNVRKQAIAASLVRTLPQGVLLWQVACEYISDLHQFVKITERCLRLTLHKFIGLALLPNDKADLVDWDTLIFPIEHCRNESGQDSP